MKKERLAISIILPVIMASGLFINLCGASTGKKTALQKKVDVTGIEENIQEMKKKLDAFPENLYKQKNNLKRDPFVSPFINTEKDIRQNGNILKEQDAEITKEEVISPPDFIISGILYGEKPQAIIGTEVKEEGDFLGEYQVYKIAEDRVLIKYRDKIFAFEITRSRQK
ncbi:MAG TPA: hypothetical protein PKN36_07870 [bacterium]|jgi:hypothetical protein|nr:hypothetical protein [bacterium]